MRKSYQTQEYKNVPVSGTLIMAEQRHFLGSKMMALQNSFTLGNESDSLKSLYLGVPVISVNQSSADAYTSWNFLLQTKNMLRDRLYGYIWADNNSDFNDINLVNTPTQRLSDSVLDYVNSNLLGIYGLSQVIMWVAYYPLTTAPFTYVGKTINILKNTPVFSDIVDFDSSVPPVTPEKITLTDNNDGTHTITYKQTQPANISTYVYYMDFVFTRI